MRWEGQRESGNVEDRRGMGPARVGGVGGLGLGGIVLCSPSAISPASIP